jgi:hypothetical protein
MILDLLGGITPIINKVLSYIPDPAARQAAELQMQQDMLKFAAEQGAQQAEINKVEAANTNIFVSGWRPFLGWTCGAAFAWNYVGFPAASWLVAVCGYDVPLKPVLDNGLMELTLGMLGLGAMRSFEKLKGVAR